MNAKRFLIYFLILLITAYPASAGDVTLNRWVLNVTLNDEGLVEEAIQVEIENTGSTPLDGFSFVVPASAVTMVYDFDHTSSFTGQTVEQQAVPGGVKIIINFNRSIEAGKKWDGRVGFTAEKWAVKEGPDYSINIPIKAPQAIVSGKNIEMSVPEDADIRSQVFLPKAVDATSVQQIPQQKPYKKLFQYNRIVITWFTGNLRTGDVIKINGSFSEVLNKIVETNEKLDSVSARIEEEKKQGADVSESEARIKNATDYLNQAEVKFWEKDSTLAIESVGYANDELKLAENSLSAPAKTEVPAEETEEGKKTPGFGAASMILVLLISLLVKKKR